MWRTRRLVTMGVTSAKSAEPIDQPQYYSLSFGVTRGDRMYKCCDFPSFLSTFSSLNQPEITIKPAFVRSAFQHPQSLPNPNNNHLQHALQPSHLGRRRLLCLSANQRNRYRQALRCWRHSLCQRCWLLCRELDGANCLRQFPGFMHEQRTVRIQHLRGRFLQRHAS